MVKWDREGNLQYTWGTWGDFPAACGACTA
jgi:hypothetical protein